MLSTPSPGNVIAAAVVWPVLGAVAVWLRFYTRRCQRVSLLADDWLTLPALILTTGMAATLISGVALKSLAYPTPPPPIPDQALTATSFELRTTRQVLWAVELQQILALGCIKLSFLFFYRRLFCTGHQVWFNRATIFMIVVTLMWTGSLFLAFLFACKANFWAFWYSVATVGEYCFDTLLFENALAISDLVTDIIVFLMPLPMIWGLHMSLSRKLAVIGIFALGAVTLAASTTRMVFFIQAVQAIAADFQSKGDDDRVTATGLYWCMIESGLGLLAACLPTLYALAKTKGFFGGSSGDTKYNRSYNLGRLGRSARTASFTDKLGSIDDTDDDKYNDGHVATESMSSNSRIVHGARPSDAGGITNHISGGKDTEATRSGIWVESSIVRSDHPV